MIPSAWKGLVLAWIVIGLSACANTYRVESPALYKAILFNEMLDGSLDVSYVDTMEIDKQKGVIRYDDGRIVIQLSDCGDNTWECISDGNTEFAIRRDWHGVDKSWSYRGIIYSVIQGLQEPSGGREDRAYFILASPEGKPSEVVLPKIYLYSKERGIIGITKLLKGRDGLVPVTYIRVDS